MDKWIDRWGIGGSREGKKRRRDRKSELQLASINDITSFLVVQAISPNNSLVFM